MQGYGVSKGLCYGKVLVLKDKPVIFPTETGNPAEETNKFLDAQADVLRKTMELKEKISETAGATGADILDVHCTLLTDDGLVLPIKDAITNGSGAAAAVEQVMSGLVKQFEEMGNEYFAQRASDIRDIKENLVRRILHIEKEDISYLPEPVILAGHDITPSTTAGMDVKMVAGMLMEMGGVTSHTAILAKTLDIPAVVGVKGLLSGIETGQYIGFDGESGEVFLNPDSGKIKDLLEGIACQKEEKERRNLLVETDAVTKDGIKVEVCGNIGTPDDADKVLERGGEGIGLFRSEFLYLSSRTLPDEDRQYTAYRRVLETLHGKPVIVRTLDIGGDKEVPALCMAHESNPFMGLRAIRLCRKEKEVFHTQLRALLRASVYGELKLMFPMISSLEELRWAKEQLEICKKDLKDKNIPYKEEIPVGIMIEIPATAICAEQFAGECNFFSIGTNDLTQYALAVDRGNEEVAELYTYFHPAVLKLIQMTIDGAHKKGIPCGMCGEAAGDPKMIPLLVGMGLDEYSMAASAIPEVKELIGKLDTRACKILTRQILEMDTAIEIEKALQEYITRLSDI